MIIHDFDRETPSMIDMEAFYGPRRHQLDKCLILFSREIHDHLLAAYDCTVIGRIGACNGNTPIYRFLLDELTGDQEPQEDK